MSTALFAKLNLKAQSPIHILDAPASFDAELALLDGVEVRRSVRAKERVAFGIAFAQTQARLDALSKALAAAADGDAILWIAYPKGTSRNYTCEFNRDSGWTVLGAAGFEPVRMVAIDADWSALRFRKAEHIKTLTRDVSRTHSTSGRKRASGK
jgi:hypothetical protein